MNDRLLTSELQEYIASNWMMDTASLLLKKPIFPGLDQVELAIQLEGKKKSRLKLPTWFAQQGIYYPKKLHLEQSSSEATAQYKAELVQGGTLVDLTGGFGVDANFFAKKMGEVHHCETNPTLSDIVTHNARMMGIQNLVCHHGDGLAFLKHFPEKVDWVYVDPSRRNEIKGKVFTLEDSLPNIPQHLDEVFEKTENLMIKTAPLLDISRGIKTLRNVRTIHIVAVKNEVKEVLWVLKKGYDLDITVKTANLSDQKNSSFDFKLSDEKKAVATYGKPSTYLYEPNAALLKAGAFKTIGNAHQLLKLHEHSHLYTSGQLVNFPGRRFQIKEVLTYNKKSIKELALAKANITVRNFPHSVTTIRKKFNIKDGGNDYLFFTTGLKNQLQIIYCEKI